MRGCDPVTRPSARRAPSSARPSGAARRQASPVAVHHGGTGRLTCRAAVARPLADERLTPAAVGDERRRPALQAPLAIAGVVLVVLVAFSAGYGYHRDELYFLAAGDHLDWGFADQGPLAPLVAHLMDAIAPGSLTVLRLPSALTAAATVVTTALIAFELGGTRRAQLIAAACAGAASIVLVVGHLLSTTTFDVLAWALVTLLLARVLRTGDDRLLVPAGLVVGVALLDKPLIAFFLAAFGVAVAIAGPRRLLASGWLWAGVAVALVAWAPWLLWQNAHDWPQLEVSSAIASGGSGSSQPRWALLPFQLLLVSPVLAPVWIVGLVALLRRPRLRPFRVLAVTWVVLVAIFLVVGGKPYYLAGMFPVLLAAGAIETDGWLARRSGRGRAALLAGAIVLSFLVSAVIALPVLPARDAGPVIAANADVGETIGWPDLVRTVAAVYRQVPGSPVVFTANYGEAGAIRRYGPALGLPRAYSGHNSFGDWGPPPDRPGPVVAVGLDETTLARSFRDCRLAARVENAADVDNDEQGEPVVVCAGTRGPWSSIWPGLRHLN